MSTQAPIPTLDHERHLWASGFCRVAGLDEAGRGAWAGPVVAAAVILPADDPDVRFHLAKVRDSKRLTATQRETLLPVIHAQAVGLGVGAVPPAEIDDIGIVPATRKAMALALARLSPVADYLLLDHISLPDIPIRQASLPKGDALVLSIAAASIVAKVSRDRIKIELESEYPGYGFARHKGYGTAQHRAALIALGPSQIHRHSFAPLRQFASSEQEESHPASRIPEATQELGR